MGQERKPVVDRFHLTHIQVLITVLITIRDVPGEPPPAVERNANTSGGFSRGGGADETFGIGQRRGRARGSPLRLRLPEISRLLRLNIGLHGIASKNQLCHEKSLLF